MHLPIIGITCDTTERRARRVSAHAPALKERHQYASPFAYAQRVAEAGGVPVLLPFCVERIGEYVSLCDGFLLSGGDDPDTGPFGEAVHAKADVMHAGRQAFEVALIEALREARQPVLGVCLGMQLMALAAGGSLHQHLPEAPGFDAQRAAAHDSAEHAIRCVVDAHPWLPQRGRVFSRHHQAVADAGAMRIAALSVTDDAGPPVIEAIDRDAGDGRFYLGVQWHPEQTADRSLGMDLIARFIRCATKP